MQSPIIRGFRLLSSAAFDRRVDGGGLAIGTRPVPDFGVEVARGTRPVPLRGVDAGMLEEDFVPAPAMARSSCSRLCGGKDFRAAGAQARQTASRSSLYPLFFSKSELLS